MKSRDILSKIQDCTELQEAGPYLALAIVYGVNNMEGGDFLDMMLSLADELSAHFDVPEDLTGENV